MQVSKFIAAIEFCGGKEKIFSNCWLIRSSELDSFFNPAATAIGIPPAGANCSRSVIPALIPNDHFWLFLSHEIRPADSELSKFKMKAPWATQHVGEGKSQDPQAVNADHYAPKTFRLKGWNFRAQNGPILDSQKADM
jgi:hypothetical protein